ncbi:Serine--tRNA ligase [compost metagenome]
MSYKMNSKTKTYKLDFRLSKLEKDMTTEFCDLLDSKGFQYLSIPTSITWDTFRRQQSVQYTHYVDDNTVLSGSAEQGILEYFAGEHVEPMKIYAMNACFRQENRYTSIRLKEFKKIEQFCFTTKDKWPEDFDILIQNAIQFLISRGIQYRVVNKSIEDPGYHTVKFDIEIYTEKWGWVETHSCSYFREEQSSRFNITGATHTISCTGLAFPRMLLPFIDQE